MPMLIVNSDSSDIGLYTNSEKLLTKKTFVLITIQINLLVEIFTCFSHKKMEECTLIIYIIRDIYVIF